MDFKSEKIGDIGVVHVYLTRATLAKAVNFKDFATEVISSGTNKLVIGAMVALLKKVNSLSGDLRLVYNKETPSLVFVLTRMDKVFKIFPNLQDAVDSFSAGKPKLNWK